jgi:hypothetical protein
LAQEELLVVPQPLQFHLVGRVEQEGIPHLVRSFVSEAVAAAARQEQPIMAMGG